MEIRIKTTYSILILLATVSCRKEELPSSGDRTIFCTVDVGATKSLPVSTDSLQQEGQSFRMDAWLEAENRTAADPSYDKDAHYIKNATMTNSGGKWSSPQAGVIWTDNVWTNFWAMYPVVLPGRGELTWPASPSTISDKEERKASFTYDMSAYIDAPLPAILTTPEILVAYSREKWNETEKTGGELNLKFRHTLSSIRLDSGKFEQGSVIDSILITGICSKGICSLYGYPDSLSVSWAGTDTLINNRCFKATLMDDNIRMFIIPQNLTSKAKIILYVTDPHKKKHCTEVSLKGFTWKAGYNYEYEINFLNNDAPITCNIKEYSIIGGTWN